MPHRPDPVDLHPIKLSVYGLTGDGQPFRTGFWSMLWSLASPPTATDGTNFRDVLRPFAYNEIVFLGWGWKTKAATIPTDTPFSGSTNGTVGFSSTQISRSATIGYGGVAVDDSGLTRNIRCISHMPRGYIDLGSQGSKRVTIADSRVSDLLGFLVAHQATDNFGRNLRLYGYVDTQNNAWFQQKRGF